MIDHIISLLRDKPGFFYDLFVQHFWICVITISIAGIIGLILGIFISEKKKFKGPVLGVTNVLYTIPSISLLGILIPFTGVGNVTAVIALTVYALLPMIRNTATGLSEIDKEVLEAAKGMGSSPWQILYKIKLPLATPVIMAGLRNMVVMTIALAGIASFIGAGGLGVAIYRGITTNNMAMTVLGSLLIAGMALLADFFFSILEKLPRKKRSLTVGITALLIIILAAVQFWPKEDQTIKIATKPMTEQFILGEMLALIIEEHTDLSVELTKGIGGGTSNIQPALLKGDFDLYPEYTGTAWNYVLKKPPLTDETQLFKKLQQTYSQDFNLNWFDLYGFNNTYGIVVRKELAEQYDLKTYSDLKNISSNLVFGAEYDFFEREDGFDALASTYGFQFKKQMDLDIGLKYNAINSGEIDVMNVFTTDGQLSVSDVVLLKDDLKFYPNYYCGTVIRQETLDKYPELKEALSYMNHLITNDDMIKMNFQVENGADEKKVALEFLKSKGVVK